MLKDFLAKIPKMDRQIKILETSWMSGIAKRGSGVFEIPNDQTSSSNHSWPAKSSHLALAQNGLLPLTPPNILVALTVVSSYPHNKRAESHFRQKRNGHTR